MKKIVVILMCVFAMSAVVSCDRVVSADKLPAQAKQFVTAHFNGIEVLSVRKDGFKYDVVLFDGTEIEFSHGGQWIEVDCGLNPLPDGVLPANTAKYLTAKFPMNFATHVKFEHKRYEVELDNDLDLLFDKNGNFMGADD
ncbi:MAG: PepSY-like domain-containing protein [Bacteroidales bacterium]|nr:PepSY-like domain-containing protein [Bacteroidales bacterium]